jgi:hypothetical protein
MTVACSLALACGLQTSPKLVDTLGDTFDQTGVVWEPDLRPSAPEIVTAVVGSNRVVVANVPSARLQGVSLDLHLVHVSCETVLRGDIPTGDFRFYYYDESPDTRQHNPRYKRPFAARPGRRYLFFLKRDMGVLRSVGDVGEYSVEIASGRHWNLTTKRDSIAQQLAEVMLSLGESPDLGELQHVVRHDAELAKKWGSPDFFTTGLLQQLLTATEPVRQSACQALIDLYGWHECRAKE